MRQASEELKNAIESGSARLYQEAHIVFSDGRSIDLGKTDFYLSGNGFSDGAGTNALALGEAMAKSINMVLVNDNDQLSEYDFYHAMITVWCCCDIQESVERMKIGTFTIETPTAREGEIEITGNDEMYKGDVDYDTTLSFPATAKQIFLDSCRKCGVTPKRESFTNDNFVVLKKPTQCTHRAVWGMIAMLAGGNARMDEDNLLEIISYDLSFFARRGLDGGKFDNGEPLYQTGDTADGGNFIDYSSGDTYDGGGFEELGRYHMFYNSQTPTIDTDNVVITGVQASSGDSAGLYGAEGYVLTVENQMIAGKVQEGVNAIGQLITGMKFRPFMVDHTSYPLAEFGDICYVFDRKGNYYQSVITDINFSFYGYTTIKCSADSVMRNRAEYKPAAAGIIADVEKQTDERFEDVSQDIDGINSDIYDINSNVGNLKIELKKTDDGLHAEVSRATSAENYIGSRVDMTENSINAEVIRAQGAENTLSSRINMTAESITAEVIRAQGAENTLSSRINMTADSITAEVSRATAAEGALSGRISITENNINAKVSKGDVVSEINLSLDEIILRSGRLIIETGNFQLDRSGNMTANGGNIAGFNINSSSLTSPYGGTSIEHNVLRTGEVRPNSTANIFMIGSNSASTEIYGSPKLYGNVYMPSVYGNSTTADPNMHITSTGYLNTKGGSSRRWKHDIGDISDATIDPHRLYNVKCRQFIYNDDYIAKGDSRRGKFIPGFIIEELEKDYPIAVDYDEFGSLSTWSPSMLVPGLLSLLQEHKKKIDKLEAGMSMLMFLYGQSARSNVLC